MFTRKEIEDLIRNERREIAKTEEEIRASRQYIGGCKKAIGLWEGLLASGEYK